MSVLVGFGSFSSSVSVWSNKVGAVVVLVENTAMHAFSSDKLSGVSTQTNALVFSDLQIYCGTRMIEFSLNRY